MLVTSIFSFSHNVFYPFKEKFNFFEAKPNLSSALALNLDIPQYCVYLVRCSDHNHETQLVWWLWSRVSQPPHSRPGGCEFDFWLRRLFFLAYFCLSPLQKHVRKLVGGFGKKSFVSTGVRKPGNTYSPLTAMI